MEGHQDGLRAEVASFAADFGATYHADVLAGRDSPDRLWEALARRGWLGLHLPAKVGGGGRGLAETAVVVEELAAAGSPVLGMLFSPGVVGAVLAAHATPDQARRWLEPVARGRLRAAFALTELDAGSNTHAIATRARRTGGGHVLRGEKHWVSGADRAALLLVLAVTEPARDDARAQLTLFAVDREAPGVRLSPMPTAIEVPERQFAVSLDEVAISDDRRIGASGQGLRVAFSGMSVERVLTGALCVGIGRHALGLAARRVTDRQVWGRPLGGHQGVAHPLADAWIRLEAAGTMVARAAAEHDAGLPAARAANVAKYLGAEAGGEALDRAIQVHGGLGVAPETGLTRYWWLVRTLRIGPVAQELVLNDVAERCLGLPRPA
ncbi:acyl-CoA dehydrogenase family protein [Conexibacter sp. SYSU D00693]|uniref:acyl-CoA dehydrogenase family protein n=1 Tax=Conexibacter sp. SYSU D00693 TaxID=2812560 RepID=UPI00196AA749|nr:acyl-CoA dehydrogenase family protein [Conexibacter sp. SYSU D00693]